MFWFFRSFCHYGNAHGEKCVSFLVCSQSSLNSLQALLCVLWCGCLLTPLNLSLSVVTGSQRHEYFFFFTSVLYFYFPFFKGHFLLPLVKLTFRNESCNHAGASAHSRERCQLWEWFTSSLGLTALVSELSGSTEAQKCSQKTNKQTNKTTFIQERRH